MAGNFSMFKWLCTLTLSHFGVLDPNYKRGFYTGVGRAKHLLDMVNKKSDEKVENLRVIVERDIKNYI